MAGLLLLTVIFFCGLTLGMLGSLTDNHPEFQLAIISVGPGMGNNDWIWIDNSWSFKIVVRPDVCLRWLFANLLDPCNAVPQVELKLKCLMNLSKMLNHVQLNAGKLVKPFFWDSHGVHFRSFLRSLSLNQPSLRVILIFNFFLTTSSNWVTKMSSKQGIKHKHVKNKSIPRTNHHYAWHVV